MDKLKYFIYIAIFNNLFAGDTGGGSWINDWLMPNTGLTLWTIVTFFVKKSPFCKKGDYPQNNIFF